MLKRDSIYQDFQMEMFNCIANSWMLFEERDRIRPGDAPYNASYIENLAENLALWLAELKPARPQPLGTQEQEIQKGDGGREEGNPSSTKPASMLIETGTRVQRISVSVEPGVEEMRRNQAPDTDRSIPESFEQPPPPSGPWRPPQDSSLQLPSLTDTFPPPPYGHVPPDEQHGPPLSTRPPEHTSTSIVVQRVFDSSEGQNYTQDNVNPLLILKRRTKGNGAWCLNNSSPIAEHPPSIPMLGHCNMGSLCTVNFRD